MGKRYSGVVLNVNAHVSEFAEVLDAGDEFRAGNRLRGERGGLSWFTGTTSDPAELELLRNERTDFAVYTYAEPIAVRVSWSGWYVIVSSSSSTTSDRHRRRIYRAIESRHMWAPDARIPEFILAERAEKMRKSLCAA